MRTTIVPILLLLCMIPAGGCGVTASPPRGEMPPPRSPAPPELSTSLSELSRILRDADDRRMERERWFYNMPAGYDSPVWYPVCPPPRPPLPPPRPRY